MHPSGAIRATKSRHLEGRRIVLGVSGSIAVVEAVRVAHELIRHGADVIPVMTRAAADLLQPAALEYATGHAPILQLSGAGEHVALCGGGRGSADLLLVAPATANTLAKMALGIDDTALTSCATVALGAGLPVLVAPAMHEVMGRHPGVQDRLRDLQRLGVHVVAPRREEGKDKIAGPEDIAHAVIHHLARGPLAGRHVLIISGSTAEPLDPVRVLTNRSTGHMGVALATEAYDRGAHVDLWNAWGSTPLPAFARVTRFQTVADLKRLVERVDVSRYDAILVPAALSDFAPRQAPDKVSSDGGAWEVPLEPLPKVLPLLRQRAPDAVVVGFKVESRAQTLLARARERLEAYDADFFVANTSDAMGAAGGRAWLVEAKGRPKAIKGSKESQATLILDQVTRRVGGGRA